MRIGRVAPGINLSRLKRFWVNWSGSSRNKLVLSKTFWVNLTIGPVWFQMGSRLGPHGSHFVLFGVICKPLAWFDLNHDLYKYHTKIHADIHVRDNVYMHMYIRVYIYIYIRDLGKALLKACWHDGADVLHDPGHVGRFPPPFFLWSLEVPSGGPLRYFPGPPSPPRIVSSGAVFCSLWYFFAVLPGLIGLSVLE